MRIDDMKILHVSYKQLYEIVSALEFKLSHEESRDWSTLDEDQIADLENDKAFIRAILSDMKATLANWHELPSAPR